MDFRGPWGSPKGVFGPIDNVEDLSTIRITIPNLHLAPKLPLGTENRGGAESAPPQHSLVRKRVSTNRVNILLQNNAQELLVISDLNANNNRLKWTKPILLYMDLAVQVRE